MSNEERPTNLAVVDCCATCTQMQARAGYPWCERYAIRVLPQKKCDTFERDPRLPLWVIVEPVEN